MNTYQSEIIDIEDDELQVKELSDKKFPFNP
jgi:hypothetical protein